MAAKAAPKKNLSAIKRARQAEKKNERNRMARTKIKNVMKDVESAVRENNKEASGNALVKAMQVLSSAKSKGIIHKNTVARKISNLTRKVNAVLKAGAE